MKFSLEIVYNLTNDMVCFIWCKGCALAIHHARRKSYSQCKVRLYDVTPTSLTPEQNSAPSYRLLVVLFPFAELEYQQDRKMAFTRIASLVSDFIIQPWINNLPGRLWQVTLNEASKNLVSHYKYNTHGRLCKILLFWLPQASLKSPVMSGVIFV